ncbi:MAG TPA: amidohydrolase family protein [Thermoanaerobaculia bacterium]|jgi:imidazolonepropionase-like amidohydrolase
MILAAALLLTHVNIIDLQTGKVLRDAAIRIGLGEARVFDGRGKFVIPGLWDMHTHIPDDNVGKNAYLPLFIANGVTGIRVMEGSPELYRWRDAGIEPRMVVASPILDGPKTFLPDAVVVRNADEARKAVRDAKRAGADFIKVYDNLSRESYFAIASEAKRLKIPVAGHLPAAITPEEASKAGQVSIEHLTGMTAQTGVSAPHIWQCPTLIMRHNYGVLDDPKLANDPRLKYVRRSTRERWLRMLRQSADYAARRTTFASEKKLVGAMAKGGVGILAGTDNGNPFCFPGFSLHDELALLVESGLTPLQALQTATVNPLRFLNPKPSADLIILDANPLDDIRNTKKINAVVIGGRLLERKDLDALLKKSEAIANER